MKTGIVRICSAVAINIKGGRPLSASPSSDHFVSYNCWFYGSFKAGFIVRRCLQREGDARPRRGSSAVGSHLRRVGWRDGCSRGMLCVDGMDVVAELWPEG